MSWAPNMVTDTMTDTVLGTRPGDRIKIVFRRNRSDRTKIVHEVLVAFGVLADLAKKESISFSEEQADRLALLRVSPRWHKDEYRTMEFAVLVDFDPHPLISTVLPCLCQITNLSQNN